MLIIGLIQQNLNLVAWTSLVVYMYSVDSMFLGIIKLFSWFDWLLASGWSFKFATIWSLISQVLLTVLVFMSRIINNIHTHIRKWVMLSLIFVVLVFLNSWLRVVKPIWLETCFAKDLLTLIIINNVDLISDNKCCMLFGPSVLSFFNNALILSLYDLSTLLLLLCWLLLFWIHLVDNNVSITSLFEIINAWWKSIIQSIVTKISQLKRVADHSILFNCISIVSLIIQHILLQ